MKPKSMYLMLLLMIMGVVGVKAQNAVTVGTKVTDASSLVSGKTYVIKYTSMTGTPYIEDIGTTSPLYAPSAQNNATVSTTFYFLNNGNGTWKIENAYTGNYWPAPTGNERLYPTTSANAGNWAIAISDGTATFTCENGGTTYGLDRLTPDVVGWSSRKTVEVYETESSTLSNGAYSLFSEKDISVSSTEAASLSEGQWYIMYNRGRHGYVYEDNGSLKNASAQPSSRYWFAGLGWDVAKARRNHSAAALPESRGNPFIPRKQGAVLRDRQYKHREYLPAQYPSPRLYPFASAH